jgi:hypothetical protein
MPTIGYTRTGKEVVRALANLNDQYSFFLFLEHQFSEQLQALNPSTAYEYTSQVFSRNPFSSRIHVRIGKLPNFLQANRGVSFGAYLSTSYEVASGFTEKAYELLRATNSSSVRFPSKRPEGPEQYYTRVLTASGYPLPPQELIDTMTFIRLRRNSIVHLSSVPSPTFHSFVTATGQRLDTYWKNSRVQVDFSRPAVGAPTELDSLDLIKLLRVVTQKLDAHLATIVDISGIVHLLAREMFENEKIRMNLYVRQERAAKLRHRLTRDFGFAGSSPMIEAAVKTIGVR